MPELPDIEAYAAAVEARVRGQRLLRVRLRSPFLLRTADPPIAAAEGRAVVGVRRLGKRLVLALEGGLFLSLHLMIAGRLHWRETRVRAKDRPDGAGPERAEGSGGTASPSPPPGHRGKPLAELEFPGGVLLLTEAGTKRRAAMHLVGGEAALAALDRGGVEPLQVDRAGFAAALARESHTLKRALTDPAIFAGIGNAYSDEILHRARLSPMRLTRQLGEEEVSRLFDATRAVLEGWRARLLAEARGGFPEKVTAFREGFAVHGRYRLPCPDCGAPVQRIVRADHETNYCPRCQTGGQILSDRSLARLLKEDWPRTLEELEEHPGLGRKAPARRGPG